MNVYIYSEGRTPSSDTVLYLPMKEDLLDHSGNNITVNNTNVVISNGCGYFDNSSGNLALLSVDRSTDSRIQQKPFTISLMAKFIEMPATNNSDQRGRVSANNAYASGYKGWNMGLLYNGGYKTRVEFMPSGGATRGIKTDWTTNTRYNFILSVSSNTRTLYINGVQDLSSNATITFPNRPLYIGGGPFISSDIRAGAFFYGYMSEYIFESKSRTAQDAADYYNQIKNLYH